MAKLYLLIGPSGAGKNLVQEAILAKHPDFFMPKGVFTRPYRPAELSGEQKPDSESISIDRFTVLWNRGELTAVNEVHGNWYGTPKAPIREALERGQNVIRIFTADGTDQAKEHFSDVEIVTIFLVAPLDTLRERLIKRGDKPADIERRLKTAEYELTRTEGWDYLVDADRPADEVAAEVLSIVESELAERTAA